LGGILEALVAAEIPEERIIGISQGWKMTGAIKTAERKLAEGVLIHGGQPLMNWCVGNAKIEPRGNAVIITKQAAGTAKIDPLMAAFNAITLMSLNPESTGSIDDFINNPIHT
jgi:phage terminase large subunit-like protein